MLKNLKSIKEKEDTYRSTPSEKAIANINIVNLIKTGYSKKYQYN
jgi:hypothetical protein